MARAYIPGQFKKLLNRHTALFLGTLLAYFGAAMLFNQAWAQAINCNDPAQSLQAKCIYESVIAQICWACPAFGAFFEGAIVLGYNVSTTIASGVLSLLSIGLGLWVLLQVTKMMMPFGPAAGISETFNKMASKFFVFAMIAAFVSGGGMGFNSIWSWVIGPIFNTGIDLSTAVLTSTSNLVSSNASFYNVSLKIDNTPNCAAASDARMPMTGIDRLNMSAGQDIKESGKRLGCLIFNVQKVMGMGMVLGIATAMNAGSDSVSAMEEYCIPLTGYCLQLPKAGSFVSSIVKIILAVIMGLVLLVVYLIALLIYPLYVIDAVFRFAVVVIISPILAAAYLFPITRSWCITGIKMLVAVAFSFMFQAVLVGLSLAVIVATGNAFSSNIAASSQLSFPASIAYGIVGNGIGNATGIVFFGYLIAGIMVLFLIRKGNQLAQEFAGVAVGDMGGAMAASARNAAVYAGAMAAGVGIAAAGGAAAAGGTAASTSAPASGAATGNAATAGMGGGGTGPGPAGGAAGAGGGGGTGGGGPPPNYGGGPYGGGITGVLSPSNFAPNTAPAQMYPAPADASSSGSLFSHIPASSGGSSSSASAAPSSGGVAASAPNTAPAPSGGTSAGSGSFSITPVSSSASPPPSGGAASAPNTAPPAPSGGGTSASSSSAPLPSSYDPRATARNIASAVDRFDQNVTGGYGAVVPGESESDRQARLEREREEERRRGGGSSDPLLPTRK